MADKNLYLRNTEEQISAQKREESRGGVDALSVVSTVGTIAAFMIMRRKINLSRTFSAEIRAAGAAEGNISRYLISEYAKDPNMSQISRLKAWAKNIYGAVKTPLPTPSEQLDIAISRLSREGTRLTPEVISSVRGSIGEWGTLRTFMSGPAAFAVAPRTPITIPGRSITSGARGSLYAAGSLLRIGPHGGVSSVIENVRAGLMKTTGARLEFLRTYGAQIRDFNNIDEYVRNVIAPSRRDILREQKRRVAEEYIMSVGRSPVKVEAEYTTQEIVDQLSRQIDDYADEFGGTTAAKLFRDKSGAIEDAYRRSLNQIVERELQKPYTNIKYQLYKMQMYLGIGEPFASSSQPGFFQEMIRDLKRDIGVNLKDPITGRPYMQKPGRYLPEKASLSGLWRGAEPGAAYIYPATGTAKRTGIGLIEGTFFREAEMGLGIGISTAPSPLTNFISRTVGATPGSYGEFFIRRYIGGFSRLAVAGVGAYAAFKVVNYLARQTTGWGVTDIAGKAYVTAREFQQRVLDQLTITDNARKFERTFPGTIKSPFSMIGRAMAPFWMAYVGRRMGGTKGGMLGLAMGVATALITWGDITQSPEELHKIYTGEQDIPVRKGRYWMFGKTPFGGGKISYWRPHWYPLMRSRYKYQGQLWDSETEELAQGTFPLSPFLAPILQGKLWDPYYWEKKHYRDRPYMLTAELFEPTMPFSWLLNPTIGNIIKPQRQMHQEYWGTPQPEAYAPLWATAGAGAQMGMGGMAPSPMMPNVQPGSMRWNVSMAMYTTAEQMGLRGFILNTMWEKISGRPDFLPEGPVVQSASRATGFERSYWDLNLGDPANVTEFWRRILPHRRRAIDEYNPIRNTMPNWLPGSDYFIDFLHGDPYVKAEMGEARLPGPGYESLHRLHSGVPGTYDAVDRFLILSDIAPYSAEYRQYSYLATAMTRQDKYWSEIVKQHIKQREKLREEYEFLDLEPPEDVTGVARGLSSLYRKGVSIITGPGTLVEPFLGQAMPGIFRSPFPFVASPISKYFPYKTAKSTYEQYRLYGDEFTEWGRPVEDFLMPELRRIGNIFSKTFSGHTFIPPGETQRREYEEYFDKLQYVKYKKLERMAIEDNNTQLAKRFGSMSKKTMTGINPFYPEARILGAIPKRERAFFGPFVAAEGGDREDILQMVSPQMAEIYKAQWAMRDGGARARNFDDRSVAQDAVNYFRGHNLPADNWAGWHPDIDVKDVQLKVTRNEGMDIHKFDLWETQERALARRPFVPGIPGGISDNTPPQDLENLKRMIVDQVGQDGFSQARVYHSVTPATGNSMNIKIRVKRNRQKERDTNMRAAFAV